MPTSPETRPPVALGDSVESYQHLFDEIDQGFCIIEVLFDSSGVPFDYRFVSINRAFLGQTGLADPVGRTVLEFVPNQEKHWFETYGRVVTSGHAERFEHRADGLSAWYEVFAFPTGATGQNRVGVLFGDIAARKRAEQKIQETQLAMTEDLDLMNRLRELATRILPEVGEQMIYEEILGLAIRITHAAAGTVQIMDKSAPELRLIATSGFPITMTDYFARVDATSDSPCGLALATGQRTVMNFDASETDDPNGEMRMHRECGYLSAQSTPLRSRTGRAIGMLSTHWREHDRQPSERELRFLDLLSRQAADLIERAADIHELKAARSAAETATAAKDRFIAILSHELRTPLTPVMFALEVLGDAAADQLQREAVDTIRSNVRIEAKLIDDLLDVTRIGHGKLELSFAALDLHDALRSAVAICQPDFDVRKQTFRLDLKAEARQFSGDSTRLQQVMWNLLKNAAKFTPDRGQIALRTWNESDAFMLRVQDDGIGIEPAEIPRLFLPFEQADARITREFGGLGLGLAISRAIVEGHGGMLRAESEGKGRGSSFTVTLPLRS